MDGAQHLLQFLLVAAFSLTTVLGDVLCRDPLNPFEYRFCYGITAYCCPAHGCCYDQFWKIWWFWILVVGGLLAIFTCMCRYHNTEREEETPFAFVQPRQSIVLHHQATTSRATGPDETFKTTAPPAYKDVSHHTGSTEDPIPSNLPHLGPPPPYAVILQQPQPNWPAQPDGSSPILPTAPGSNAQTR